MKKFDLTTKEGINEVFSSFICINPMFALGKYFIDKFFIDSEDKQRELAAENGAYPPTLNGLIHPVLPLNWP